jgi:hypothetical protein
MRVRILHSFHRFIPDGESPDGQPRERREEFTSGATVDDDDGAAWIEKGLAVEAPE